MTITTGPSATGGAPEAATPLVPDGVTAGDENRHRALSAAQQLRAITVELNEEQLPDLVRAGGGPERWLWRKSDFSLLGAGCALRIELPPGWARPEHTHLVADVLEAIAATGGTGRPGSGPLAIGALPYDPSLGGHLVVPRLCIGRDHGTPWATLLLPEEAIGSTASARRTIEDELAALREDAPAQQLPDGFELSARMPHDQWKQLVRDAVSEMERSDLAKVVLARRVDVVANRPFVVPDTLARLASLYPSCAVFHVEGFIGASPETLVRRVGTEILSHPLAGTVARSGDDSADAALIAGLMASAKDRREHQLVVDAIAERLRPWCRVLEVPGEPAVLALRNVSHLGTTMRGELSDDGRGADDGRGGPPNALDLAALLQPTPAVGGHPTEAALKWQRDHEGFERGWYAGPVGWLDSRGDGEWALGLRSASVSGCDAALYAGNGIVVGSDPDAELAETQLKLQALLAALVRP